MLCTFPHQGALVPAARLLMLISRTWLEFEFSTQVYGCELANRALVWSSVLLGDLSSLCRGPFRSQVEDLQAPFPLSMDFSPLKKIFNSNSKNNTSFVSHADCSCSEISLRTHVKFVLVYSPPPSSCPLPCPNLHTVFPGQGTSGQAKGWGLRL